MRNRIIIKTVFSCFLAFNSLFSQAPLNDECSTAIELQLNQSCVYQTYTNEGSTNSIGAPAPGCASYTSGDVWFYFIVPAGGAVSVDMNIGTLNDSGMAWYTGNCSSLILLECDDDDSENGYMSRISRANLTPGETVYVRIWGYNGNLGTFDVCATIPAPPPANDECINAINVGVSPDSYCSLEVNSSIESATASSQANSCFGTADDDVWFSFTATNDSLKVGINDVLGSTNDMMVVVYSGACSSLTELSCNNYFGTGSNILTNLSVGSSYYVRIFSWTSSSGQNSSFDVCVTDIPPAPINDDCSNALAVTVNNDLQCTNTTLSSIESATSSIDTNYCDGTADDDVWFTFTATSTSHTVGFVNAQGTTTDLMVAVYSGSCGNLTQISCNEYYDEGNSVINGLNIGETYYIRIYSWTSTTGQSTTFEVCVGTPPPPPANDECSGAISVPVNLDLSCSNIVAGTLQSATESLDTISCGGTADDDVWFSFTATSTNHSVGFINAQGSTTDLLVAVYSGSCGNLTQISCNEFYDEGSSIVNGLNIGETYYIRIYSWVMTSGQSTTFEVCVGTPPPPPANDDCSGAIDVPVNTDLSCTNITPGVLQSATESLDTISCGGTADDDVWFSFTATSISHTVGFINAQGSTTDLMVAVYSGSCGNLTQISCNEYYGNGNSIISNLNIGATYFVRIYSWTSTNGQNTTFDVCIGTPPPPPVNDDCFGAIMLTVNDSCSYSTYTNEYSTGSSNAPAPGCAGYSNGDVWFKFIVPTNGTVSVNTNIGTLTDSGMAWYSGSCSSLVLLECDDDDSENGYMSKIIRSNLTPGDTIYVRFWGYSGNTGTFDICASEPPAPPINDDCVNSINVIPSPTSTCLNPVSATITSATQSSQTNNCSGTTNDDVWFSFVANSPNLNIDLSNIVGTTTDLYHSVYAGTCSSLGNAILCSDPNSSSLTGLTVGNTYYVRVYSWASSSGQNVDFDICITNPSIQSDTLIFTTNSTNPSDCGTNDGNITIDGLNFGSGNISWTGPIFGSENNVTLPYTIDNLTAGNYIVIFTDGLNTDSLNVFLIGDTLPPIPVITYNGSTTICEGQNIVLTSSVSNNIIWTPSNQTSSSITVTSSGNYYVTASNNSCSSTSDTVTITVNPTPNVTISSIPNLCDTSANYTLTEGLPSGGTYTVNGIPTVEFNPGVQYIGDNIVIYTYTENGCTDTAQTTLTVLNCSQNGIEELISGTNIYPNPSSGVFEITGIDKSEIEFISIYDAVGRKVYNSKNNNIIDLSKLSDGNYQMFIELKDKSKVFKISIVK